MLRSAGAHVRRKGYHSSVKLICQTTAHTIQVAMEELTADATYRDVLLSKRSPLRPKRAILDLLFLSGTIVGTD